MKICRYSAISYPLESGRYLRVCGSAAIGNESCWPGLVVVLPCSSGTRGLPSNLQGYPLACAGNKGSARWKCAPLLQPLKRLDYFPTVTRSLSLANATGPA